MYGAAGHARLTTAGNAGLWYDKFCDRWKPDWTGFAGDSGKRAWIGEIANVGATEASMPVGDGALLNEAVRRLEVLVQAQEGYSFRRTTAWRFVSGLGRGHPVENGFAWRHELGTPYLAGSSLKGLARAYARDWEDLSDEELQRIFGPTPGTALAIGRVVFLDALPIAPVVLDADVMTPHYTPWYQGDRNAVPADWHSPNPIPFLTVAPGQTFLFAVLPRCRNRAQDRDDCEKAADLLDRALGTLGAGAKTAVGYGQFVEEGGTGAKLDPAAPAGTSQAKGPDNWAGREAIVYSEVARIIEDRGERLLVRFPDDSEEVVERSEARLR